MACRPLVATSFLAIAGAIASPASAQDATPPEPVDVQSNESVNAGRVFEPAYFAQFAPRNALDMVSRIPGFSISGGNNQGQRGLGQATQNVIVNGARLSSKSDSVEDQLRRISATDVQRIELVDGNTLDIPGLTGLVANVVYASSGVSGQYRYNAGFRAHNTEPAFLGGEVSLNGKSGDLAYTVALTNTNDRFGADGGVIITDGAGNLLEQQYSKFAGKYDNPKLATTFAYDFGGGVSANFNASYRYDFFEREDPEIGYPADGPIRMRTADTTERGPVYELGGDIIFPLGPGNLKLIGLERFERDKFSQTLVDRFDDGSDAQGYRYDQTSGIGERIARAEYGWKLWDADWQMSGEAAFNRLDQHATLFELDPEGDFVQIPFPGGIGGVREDRYETSLSVSKALSPKLSIQAIGAMEFSTIEQTGAMPNARSFRRPKGSLAATWKPRDDFDLSLTLARRVSQLQFGDFLASVSLNTDNQNGGNNELVPYQSWNVELEANKDFGAWGSLKLEGRQGWFEDFIDWFPLADGGEARGNIGDASRFHLEGTGTLKLDPLGIPGARFDISAIKRWMYVTDPFTGVERGFSYDQEGALTVEFRHDIVGSDWAYGGGVNHNDNAPFSRRYEEGRDWEGPFFDWVYLENKDVLGLTVKAQVSNAILGARNHFRRTVYNDTRPSDDIAFSEVADRRIGSIFRLTVSGDF